MRIGIAGPIEINSLKQHFTSLTSFELSLGLGGTAVNTIIDGLIKLGHTVTVFTLDAKIKNKYVLEGYNIKVVFGHFRISPIKTFDFCRKEYQQIKRFILEEKHQLDIVNAHWSYEFAIGTILAKVPHLITFRDDSVTILKLMKHPYRLVRLLMDFWVRYKGKAFSYNSKYLESKINIEGTVIPNPIAHNVVSKPKILYDNKKTIDIFFVVNGWGYLKNPITAILAFNKIKIKYTNVNLHLFGKGFEYKGLNYNSIENKVDLEGIIWHGFLTHEDIIAQYATCDILLHTSREESFGNNLIEAMSFGIPVIGGKNAGAVPWVLNYGKAGVLVDVEDYNDVALGIEKLVCNKKYYLQMSKGGLENVNDRFTQEVVVDAYIKAYMKQIEDKL
ncbi:MAG: glycosyltransferase family 4 protein [Salinivirgaceae bacterium]|jgi:glycosyltransferase involved in cell wall biosynthesis|nr:glycosyltransferase family 4 protein [Salinivirgaceae bacterium]